MNILIARKYREWLHIPRIDVIISLYHQYRKDGKYACYGKIPNSRGGVSGTEGIHRYRSQDTEPQRPQEEANRLKDWRNMADLAGRPGSVRGVSKEHRQIRIKLFILWVAHLSPVVSQAQAIGCVSATCCHFITDCHDLQQIATLDNISHR